MKKPIKVNIKDILDSVDPELWYAATRKLRAVEKPVEDFIPYKHILDVAWICGDTLFHILQLYGYNYKADHMKQDTVGEYHTKKCTLSDYDKFKLLISCTHNMLYAEKISIEIMTDEDIFSFTYTTQDEKLGIEELKEKVTNDIEPIFEKLIGID